MNEQAYFSASNDRFKSTTLFVLGLVSCVKIILACFSTYYRLVYLCASIFIELSHAYTPAI